MAYDKRHSRNPKKIQYTAPQSPRDSKKGDKRKEFIVSEQTAITDMDGVKRYPGEKIMLTEKQANFFANLGYLKLDLTFDDENDAELTKLRDELSQLKRAEASRASATGSESTPDDDGEAEAGEAAERAGAESGDGDIQAGDVQAAGSSGRGRKRTSL